MSSTFVVAKRSSMRLRVSLVATLATVAGLVLADASRAGTVPAASGTWTMTSEPRELQGKGKSYSFRAAELQLGVVGGVVQVDQPQGERWRVSFGARGGMRLKPGIYRTRQKYPDADHAGLYVTGDARACNTATGTFRVLDVRYGPHGYLHALHATFEYHCDGRAPALRGEVDLAAAAPPPAVRIEVSFEPRRTAVNATAGTLELHGTIACRRGDAGGVGIEAQVAETRQYGAVGAGYHGFNVCPKRPTAWRIVAEPSNGIPYRGGRMNVKLRAKAVDNPYTHYADSGLIYAVEVVSKNVETAASVPKSDVPRSPPLRLEIDLTYESSRTSVSGGETTVELRGTLTCSRWAQAVVNVDVMNISETTRVPDGIPVPACSATPKDWVITSTSQRFLPEDALQVSIWATAEDRWYTAQTGEPVIASDTISNAPVESPNGQASFASRNLPWLLPILAGLFVVLGWTLVRKRRSRTARS